MGDDSGVVAQPSGKSGGSRRMLWLVAGLVIGLLIAGGVYAGMTARNTSKAAQRQGAYESADTHYQNAMDLLSAAQQGLADAETTTGDPVAACEKLSSDVVDKLDSAEKEISAAEKATASIEDPAVRKSLAESIVFMRRASDELRRAAKKLPEYAPLIGLARSIVDLSDSVASIREDTILLINKNSWAAAASKNKVGQSSAATALRKLDQMEKLRVKISTAGNGTAQAQAEMKLNASMLAVQSQMIVTGRAGRISAFNSHIDAYNDLGTKLDELPPAEFYDDVTVFLEAPLTSAEVAGASLDRAEEKLADAGDAFLGNK